MDLKRYETDPRLSQEGVWKTIDGAQFLIAANNNPKHRRKLNRERKKHNPAKLAKDIDALTELSIEAAIGTVLLDWSGIRYGDQPFPFSEENARKLLGHAELRNEIFTEAQDLENFQIEATAADGANLKSGA